MANNLRGAGVLLRKLREGDGLKFPIEGDSCRVRIIVGNSANPIT